MDSGAFFIAPVNFGDMNKPLKALLKHNERAEISYAGYFTLYHGRGLVPLFHSLPRVFLKELCGERKASVGCVDIEDDSLYFLALLENFRRVLDLFP